MAFNYISAAEAASLIKHGYNIGLSGFTPAGTAKAVTAELAKIHRQVTHATVYCHAPKPSATVLPIQPTQTSARL